MASIITKEFSHLQIPLEDVIKATNNFDPNNVIGQGDLGKVYKGKLLRSGKSVKIAARRLDSKHKHGIEFLTEISVLSSLKHENIVSIIGFCDEEGEKVIINEHVAKGSLVMYLSNPKLTWIQRLRISVGVARALSYIHKEQGRSYSVIHRNINSSTILLDGKFQPKLSGFEYSIKHPVHRMDQVLLTEAIGTPGYMDPQIEKTGGVTHKSDIYSFGVVLLEMLCGRKAFLPNEDFLVSLAKFQYEKGTNLWDLIPPSLFERDRTFEERSRDSSMTFSYAALSCLKDERAQRPDMNNLVHELEKALKLQLPYQTLIRANLEHTFQLSHLSHLKIRLADITLATDNFSDAYFIIDTKLYFLFRAEIEHCDKENISSSKKRNVDPYRTKFLEEKKKSDQPKRRTTVFIKRLIPIGDKRVEEAFFRDIEMLTTCKHHNIATLIGFCDEGNEKILVVEDASNLYLANYLINEQDYIRNPFRKSQDKSILTWTKRLRICLDVAYGLKYLHHEMEDQKKVINRGFSSSSIALDENFGAKIVDFGISVFLPPNQDALSLNIVGGIPFYIDPEYKRKGNLKRESDVYSFGVVMFEILCGRQANDQMYIKESEDGLAYVARRCFHEGTLNDMIDPIIKEESDDNKDSIDTFAKIAFRCVAETQDQRPTMIVVVKELEKASSYQWKVQCQDFDQVVDGSQKLLELKLTHENPEHSDYAIESPTWNNLKKNMLKHLKIRLSDILLATNHFSHAYQVGSTKDHQFYRAELEHFDQENISSVKKKNKSELPERRTTVLIERLRRSEDRERDRESDREREEVFFKEIEMLSTCKHRNIVTLLGFCVEDFEMILVFEDFKMTLGDYLLEIKDKPILTWAERLRICLDVAYGLEYLHYGMEDQKTIIHYNIRSGTIALVENLGARIAIFGRAVFLPPNLDDDTLYYDLVKGNYGYMDPISVEMNVKTGKFEFELFEYLENYCYMDPEFMKTGKLKRECDVYSFGVLLCEILCGRLAYDTSYITEGNMGLAYVVRRCFHNGTVKDMIDPIIKEERGGDFFLNRGPNEKSLDAFLEIAVACLVETQDKRPTIKVVIEELKKALLFQENIKDALMISLEDLQLATEDFHVEHYVGGGGFGKVYKGKLPQSDDMIVAKRLDARGGQGDQQFRNELQILFEYKHDSVISLVGYCNEKDEKIIVYEYASRGSLDRYLNNSSLTWMQRLKICIDVATALDFLHRGVGTQATVIHRDIKTANILLFDDWNAKLADFGLSLISAIDQETHYVIDHACGTPGYVDPLYLKSRFLTKESDIYSFGVVLFEILGGRSTFEIHKREGVYLPIFIRDKFKKGKHGMVVFEEIKAQIKPEALNAFQTIAYQCLNENREERPKAREVVEQLKKAMQLQMSRGDGASSTTNTSY